MLFQIFKSSEWYEILFMALLCYFYCHFCPSPHSLSLYWGGKLYQKETVPLNVVLNVFKTLIGVIGSSSQICIFLGLRSLSQLWVCRIAFLPAVPCHHTLASCVCVGWGVLCA